MRKHIKGLIATLLVVILLISSTLPIFAAGQPSSYSSSRNSGERHVVCTTLDGTGALDYYKGEYSYDTLASLSSSSLLYELRELMTDTHKKQTSYSNCRDYADETDCENGNSTIITLYTSYASSHGEYNGGNGWNREHVWPQSLGGFGTSAAGADLHHIRPSENKTNGTRGNLKYGEVSGGKNAVGNLSGDVGGTYSGGYFEPLDNVKGDVARICLYVYVRWGGQYSQCSKITNVFQSVDVLLEWCALDPVDTWEMGRNEVVEGIQGNRNVFIDYPELAWALFGKEAPDNMVTPSGNTDVGGSGSGSGTVTPDKPTEPDEPDEPEQAAVKVSSVILGNVGGESYLVEGTVIATNAQSFLLADDTGAILVYMGKSWSCDLSVGDTVEVHGKSSTYANAVQFGTDATYKKTGKATVTTTVPKTIDGAAADAYLSKSSITPEYIRVSGKLTVSGNYYNLDIDGATITGSLTYPQNASALKALDGKNVTVVGYVTGVVSGKYLNILFTSVSEATTAVCQHKNAVTVNEKAATCTEDGYTGDTYCPDCNKTIKAGSVIEAAGEHTWSETTSGDVTVKTCTECGKTVTTVIPGGNGGGETPEEGDEPTDEPTEIPEDIYLLLASVESEEEKIIILLSLGALDIELIELIVRGGI